MMNEKICSAREANGMSPADLAAACGVSERTISNYERGTRTPDLETLIKICRALNVSSDYFLGLTETGKQVKPAGLDPDRAATADLLAARTYELAALDQNAGYDRDCLPVYALILDGLINLASDVNQFYREQLDQNAAFSLSGVGDAILSADEMKQQRDQIRAFEDAVLKMSAGAGIILDRVISSQLAARLINQEAASRDMIARSDEIIAQALSKIYERTK